MRSKLKDLSLLLLLGGVLAASQAAADGRYRDRVHADSFGNLIVYSASGYKRIIVGEGHMARRLNAYTAGPDVVYLDGNGEAPLYQDCPAALLKGRSYMYGLPDHVVPDPSSDFCR